MSVLIDELLSKGLITRDQLKDAKEKQLCEKKPLLDVLVEMGFINEDTLINIASKIFKMPVFDLDRERNGIDPAAARSISYEKLKHYGVFPVRVEGKELILAMSDPNDIIAIDDISVLANIRVKPVLAKKSQIQRYTESTYHSDENLYGLLKNMSPDTEVDITADLETKGRVLDVGILKDDSSPVVKLLNFILSDAIRSRASDIHIEPQKNSVAIRYRIDGELTDITKVSINVLRSLVARIKIISDLDIAEQRTPQDGRTSITAGGRIVDLRISTIPTIHGEKVEIRLLDPKEAKVQIEEIGFDEKELKTLKSSLSSSQGMILVTGPTGSGKTSTLYAALNYVKQGNKNIVTIEDPVEYLIDGINQMQVNPAKKVNFATGLRSILRQDPDVILVGEIRDTDTAEIAFRSSMTGHLVLSTLHTNSAVGTVSRLYDMEMEPYLISSSLMLVISQRLVKKLCPECREKYTPEKALLDKFSTYIKKLGIREFYRGKGCYNCNFRGYKGRTAVFEFMRVSDRIRTLINDRAPSDALFFEAKKEGLRTMAETGLLKVSKGVTSLEEVARVAEVAESDEAIESPHKIKGDIRVLVAEDEEDLLKILEKNLTTAGYKVLKARDGLELVKIAVQEKPDLIISDVTMPKMNGFEAVRDLRQKLETASIPVMMLTARDDKESELKGIEAGADDYIPKPCDHEKLLARIRMLLRRKMW
jgi:type IV pilus assembly protein PilB